MTAKNTKPSKKKFWKWLTVLGPGLTTGAADDDPSGIATYSQTGAQFGYGQLWTALYMLPFMTAVQEACARIGLVTGKGIAAVVKDNYSRMVLYGVVGLVVVANTINIGADIGAMAAAAKLLIPVPFVVLTLLFTAIILILEIFTNYKTYSRILKWLALALLSYPITVFIVHQDWGTVLRATVIPHFEFSFAFLFIITGVFGTTITPYMFFWEASQEVEEEKAKGMIKAGKPKISWEHIKTMRMDNNAGMVISEITTWCILLVGASVLHKSGIRDIKMPRMPPKRWNLWFILFPTRDSWLSLSFLSVSSGLVYWPCRYCRVRPLMLFRKHLNGKPVLI
jgi:NRAMP (natural resistance-associated macrophage protein)-like metal ion transporter